MIFGKKSEKKTLGEYFFVNIYINAHKIRGGTYPLPLSMYIAVLVAHFPIFAGNISLFHEDLFKAKLYIMVLLIFRISHFEYKEYVY